MCREGNNRGRSLWNDGVSLIACSTIKGYDCLWTAAYFFTCFHVCLCIIYRIYVLASYFFIIIINDMSTDDIHYICFFTLVNRACSVELLQPICQYRIKVYNKELLFDSYIDIDHYRNLANYFWYLFISAFSYDYQHQIFNLLPSHASHGRPIATVWNGNHWVIRKWRGEVIGHGSLYRH